MSLFDSAMDADRDSFGQKLLLELIPAALFGSAIAFAAFIARLPLIFAAAGAAAGFLLAWRGLRRLAPAEPAFALAPFEVDAFEPVKEDCGAEETLAGESPADAEPEQAGDELLLDDVLADLGPDSRVVRLFDRQPVPTAGELRARIDEHLRSGARPIVAPDATQELHQALAELRRSLN